MATLWIRFTASLIPISEDQKKISTPVLPWVLCGDEVQGVNYGSVSIVESSLPVPEESIAGLEKESQILGHKKKWARADLDVE
jgi:hypothetical protein